MGLTGRSISEEDFTAAKRMLRLAIRANPHVYDALTGRRNQPLPRDAGSYSPGQESEAGMVMDCLEDALLGNSQVAMWLFDETVARGDRPTTPQLEFPLQ